jgi:glycerophosphoryl diester phosphodiesterase
MDASRLLSLTDVTAIAHRGGSKLRPENTMVAFDHAVAIGADAIECDVHLSHDGEVVVIHDPTLDRTTDATGPVSARTARELASAAEASASRAWPRCWRPIRRRPPSSR